MEDFTFDLGIKRPAPDSRLKSGVRKLGVPTARIGEALASTALGGTIPQALVGAANLGGELITGQPIVPSYEEIYSKYVPSLKSIPKAAHAVQSGVSESMLKKLGVPQEILDRYNFQEKKEAAQQYGEHLQGITPDVGPLAPPSKLRQELTKPSVGKITEPETAFEHGLSNVSELAGFLTNPSKWSSKTDALFDIAKAGGKATLAKAGGKAGETFGGPAGGALAELLTLGAIGAAENRGMVNSAKQAGYSTWDNFLRSKAANDKPNHFIQGPLVRKLRRYITNLTEGRGESDPARSLLIKEAEQALEELVTSPKGTTLYKIRKTIGNLFNEIPEKGHAYHHDLLDIIDNGLENWSKHRPGGSQAFNAFKNSNAIHQGQRLTEKVGRWMGKYMESGKLPYAAAMFAAKPFTALTGLKIKPISDLWWKAWKLGAKGKIDAAQSTLRQLDTTIHKLYPNLVQETIFGRPEQESIETGSQQPQDDFEFTL